MSLPARPTKELLAMRLATFSKDGAARVGIVVDTGVVDLARHIDAAPGSMVELIARWPELRARVAAAAADEPDFELAAVRLKAPIERPSKIFAIGLNYADHCAESGLEVPQEQTWFSKAPSSVTGPFDPIELPAVSRQLDHECEMVAVIGRRCRNVPRERAKEVIFGYCAGNDVSVRDWQLRTSQWVLGKSFDTHAPIGPWITTADAVDPHSLPIRCLVNGAERQKSNTRNLVFDCYAQVACLSSAVTLEPGDLLFTGTCGGVGIAHKPPLWLRSGDVVRVEIGALGAIENRVVAGTGATTIG
jgi:2-keto-4-pentenoate hydratase/2-oxohepta-3-ene-1,7-dioic acid hydratase in catechol pathway